MYTTLNFAYLQIINADLTLLKLKKNEGDTHIFVMPSYVAVLWDNNNLDHYMFKMVTTFSSNLTYEQQALLAYSWPSL